MRYSSNISYRDSITEEVEKLMQKIDKKPKNTNFFIKSQERLIGVYKKIAKRFNNLFARF